MGLCHLYYKSHQTLRLSLPLLDLRKARSEKKISNLSQNRHLLGYLTVEISIRPDLFGVSLIIPLLAHEARKYGGSSTTVGLFMSLYGALQLISSPLMGQASDHFGRKFILILSLVGAGFGYFLLSAADSLLLMFLARIPTGIFKHSQAVSKAYLADITPDIQRPAILGKFNAVSSLGFILGPIFGGHIAMAERGFYKVAILSGVAFLANAIFVLIMIPDMEMSKLKIQRELKVDQCNDHHEKQTNSKQHNPQKSKPSIIELITAAQSLPWEKIADIFIIRFINSLAMIVFRSSFVVMLEFRYGTTPKQNGYILSFNGVIGAISGMIVGRIASVFSRYNDMHRFFSVLMALSLTYITFAPRLSLLVLGLVPLSLSTAVLRVTNMTALYKRAGDKEKGLLTGLGDSLTSFARMIGPTVGGITLDISMYGPGALGSLLAVGAMVLGFIRDLDGSDITLEKKLK